MQKTLAVYVAVFMMFLAGFGRTAFSQSQEYRRLSESDIEWLLGSSNSKQHGRNSHSNEIVQVGYNVPGACKPACGDLRNPACSCERCVRPCRPASTEPPVPKKAKTNLETASLESGEKEPVTPTADEPVNGIAQTAAESPVPPLPPKSAPETEVVEEVTPPVTSKAVSRAQPLPQKEKSAAKKSHEIPARPPVAACEPVMDQERTHCRNTCEPKGISCVSSFGVSGDCSCKSCGGHVDEIVASTLLGDFFQKITRMRQCGKRSGNCHEPECKCRCCIKLDMPDMVGGPAWVPGSFIRASFGESGMEVSTPVALMSRLNVAEHFNAEVRDRIWVDFRHFNNAASMTVYEGHRYHRRKGMDVDQFTFGFEKQLTARSSLELRVPVLNQFESSQRPGRLGRSDTELGNLALNWKYVLRRSSDFTLSGGLGLTFPTAEDWKLRGTGLTLANKTYYLVPYLGLQWHPNDSTFGHVLVQADVPLCENEFRHVDWKADIDDRTLVRLGMQVGRWFYRNERGLHSCRLGGFLELDYTVQTEKSKTVMLLGNDRGYLFGSKKSDAQPLNLIAGVPVMFGRLSITNAVIVPLTSNDRQCSVAYSFSVNRCF